MKIVFENKKGFAALFVTILVMLTMIGIAISITILTISEHKISRAISESTQAYYTAEAGIEDIVFRMSKAKNWSSSYNLSCGGGDALVQVSDAGGGSRTITSKGTFSNAARKIRTIYTISTEEISFYYGAQVGDGGVLMSNNARVRGNIFSNGKNSRT